MPPTPVFWPGESHGHGMSCKELDTTDQLSLHFKAEYQLKSPFFFLRLFDMDGPFLKSLLNLLQYYFCLMFWAFGPEACRILAPQPGIKPIPPALGRSPGEGNGHPLQYSGLENHMDSIVHGVTKNQIRLSDFHFTMYIVQK